MLRRWKNTFSGAIRRVIRRVVQQRRAPLDPVAGFMKYNDNTRLVSRLWNRDGIGKMCVRVRRPLPLPSLDCCQHAVDYRHRRIL